jgi:hypothetical protein
MGKLYSDRVIILVNRNKTGMGHRWDKSGTGMGQGRSATKVHQKCDIRLELVGSSLTCCNNFLLAMTTTMIRLRTMIYARPNHTLRQREPNDMCRIFNLPFYTR